MIELSSNYEIVESIVCNRFTYGLRQLNVGGIYRVTHECDAMNVHNPNAACRPRIKSGTLIEILQLARFVQHDFSLSLDDIRLHFDKMFFRRCPNGRAIFTMCASGAVFRSLEEPHPLELLALQA